jgi:hypothetical protein
MSVNPECLLQKYIVLLHWQTLLSVSSLLQQLLLSSFALPPSFV